MNLTSFFDASNDTDHPLVTIVPFNCSNGNHAIWLLLHECIFDTRGLIAVIFGFLSILSWVIYAAPQIYTNCRKGLQDEAISPWLLIFWTIGDTTNMIGAILTKQLKLQIFMAGYSICCDLVLIGQYVFAVLKHKWKILEIGPQEGLYNDDPNYIDSISVSNSQHVAGNQNRKLSPAAKTGGATLFCATLFICANFVSFTPTTEVRFVSRTLLSDVKPNTAPFLIDNKEIIGYVLGCLSSMFYCSGRLPQIYRNFTRKCTVGLSYGLFLFALIGNATYGAQIVTTSVERIFILRHLPWLIGSWGVMLLDSTILAQCFWYKNNPPHPYSLLKINPDDSTDDEMLP